MPAAQSVQMIHKPMPGNTRRGRRSTPRASALSDDVDGGM
jgi:hypothetical protein